MLAPTKRLCQIAALALSAISIFSLSSCTPTDTPQTKLAPGQYEWHPENSPSGPVLMVVSLDDQMAYVYRNGVQIARSTVSTGKPGHSTPTGVFTILQRDADHRSSLYNDAPMPYMQRLTWGGIAMHAGYLPGYPASHGCIRLPYGFSKKLYGTLHHGATVVITKAHTRPTKTKKPASILLASKAPATERAIPNPEGKVVWNPSKSRTGPFSLLISYADKTMYVWRNGIQIGQTPIGIRPGAKPAEGVFMMLAGKEANGNHAWTVLSITDQSAPGDSVSNLRSDLYIPHEFSKKIKPLLKPGTLLITTKDSSNKNTRSGRNFKIIN